jgi:hypothetical protein
MTHLERSMLAAAEAARGHFHPALCHQCSKEFQKMTCYKHVAQTGLLGEMMYLAMEYDMAAVVQRCRELLRS